MKFNISYPVTGLQKKIEVDDDKKIRHFYDRKMGQEIDGDVLGDEFKGYIFRITGGNDKQGFPMKQGVLVNGRVRLLLKKKTTTYRPKRKGERKRKSVRGCILGPDLAVIALRIQKKGESEIEGVTDGDKPRRLGPKRANYIRKVFALRKKDDVRKYVVRREIKRKDKTFFKSPKIQRLITDKRIRRKKLDKKHMLEAWKARKDAKIKYDKLLSQYIKEKKALTHHKDEAPVVVEKKPEAKPATTTKKVAPKKEEAKTATKAPVKTAAPVKTTAAPAKAQAPAPEKKTEPKKGGKK